MYNEGDLSNRLSDKELDELAVIFDGFPNEYAISDPEMLDGFFSALICCPHVIPPSKFIHVIYGNEEDDVAPFDDIKEYERFFGLLMRYWNSVAARVQNDGFEPFIEDMDEDYWGDYGRFWADGFLMGVSLSDGAFDKIAAGEKESMLLFPILTLACDETFEDADIIDKEMTPDVRRELVSMLRYSIPAMHYFLRNPQELTKITKIGRNDPCYCGSGKKYKKCCLNNTLH